MNRAVVAVAFVVALSSAAAAEPLAERIIAQRPRIYVRTTDWDGPTIAKIRANLGRPEFKARFFKLENRKSLLARCLLWYLHGDEKDLQGAIDALKKYRLAGNDSPSYQGPGLAQAAAAYDWLHQKMDEETRAAIRENLEAGADRMMRVNLKGEAPLFYSRHPGALEGVLTVGLALHGDSPKAETYLKHFRTWGMKEFFKAQAWAGGAPTGGSYALMFTHVDLARMMAAWWSATGQNLAAWCDAEFDGLASQMLRYHLWAFLPDARVLKENDIWDGAYIGHSQVQQALDILTCLLRDGHGRALQVHLNTLMTPHNYHSSYMHQFFIFQDPTIKPEPLDTMPHAWVMGKQNAGYAFFRGGWKPRDPLVFFRAGTVMNVHGHVDMGQFQIYKGVPLAIKAGDYGTYGSSQHNYNRNAIGCNTVIFTDPNSKHDWGNQLGGGGQKKNNPSFDHWMRVVKASRMATAKIIAFDAKPGEARVKADLSRTNRSEKCKHWTRELIWLADKHLIVADVIEKGDPKFETRWLLHSLTEPKVDGNLVTIRTALEEGVKTAYLDTKPAMLFCRTLLPEKPVITKIGGKGKECFVRGRNAIRGRVTDKRNFEAQIGRWRVEVTPPGTPTAVLFLHVLTPAEDGASPPAARFTRDGDVVTVIVDGKTARVSLGR